MVIHHESKMVPLLLVNFYTMYTIENRNEFPIVGLMMPYNGYFTLPLIFANFVNIKQELLRYVKQNFASFGPLCFAR